MAVRASPCVARMGGCGLVMCLFEGIFYAGQGPAVRGVRPAENSKYKDGSTLREAYSYEESQYGVFVHFGSCNMSTERIGFASWLVEKQATGERMTSVCSHDIRQLPDDIVGIIMQASVAVRCIMPQHECCIRNCVVMINK